MSAYNIDQIDEVIHGRLRLGIMAYLANNQVAEFTDLRNILQTTDGNLSVQLRNLEEAGYVDIEKAFVKRKSLTKIKLTRAGRKAFLAYLDAVARLVKGEGQA